MIALCLAFASGTLAAPTDPPAPDQLAQARAIVKRMMENSRGPYQQIRWFCADGSILPPQSYACRDRGGGRQHAQYSAEREVLATLGFHVGTIFAALGWDEFFDADARHQRMRELSLEAYLTEVDQGWVLRRAMSYRGRAQAEAETAAGRTLLLTLLGDTAWLASNYLLARETVRVVPHGIDTDDTRGLRRAVQSLAEAHPSAAALRNEIHNAPTPGSAAKVRQWALEQADPVAAAEAEAVAAGLDALFSDTGRRARIESLWSALRATAPGREAAAALTADGAAPTAFTGGLLAALRDQLLATSSARVRLTLFDLLGEFESELLAAYRPPPPVADLAEGVSRALDLMRGAYGVGLLSPGELRAAVEAAPAARGDAWTFAEYQTFVHLLQRVPQWAVGSVRYTFAEPLARYVALDPRAARFVDDTLRSSPLFPLGSLTRLLASDLQQRSGVGISLLGEPGTGVIALNAGFARGTLRIYSSEDDLTTLARDDVAVIPETAAELAPAAGILTLGEGNPLSHVQLLARNFGIPNAAIGENVLRQLEPHDGQRVLLVVGADGSVALLKESRAERLLGDLLAGPDPHLASSRIRVPRPDLTVTRMLPIAELHKGLSGRVVGPKAANLGELNRLFPGRVAPAIAIPFGLFARYTAGGDGSIRQQLEQTYAAFRRGRIDEATLNAHLAEIRTRIATLRFGEVEELAELMAEVFGPGETGVFVRSDTNVEDLPEFTGAGLSETLPNVVGLDAQVQAIPRVWASVLSPRAIAWRSNLLENPADVYASVLLMRSVPSSKSGVLVTSNLITPDAPGLTVSTAWGVGGAVAGEAASTRVLAPDGSTRLVSEAKTPYRRVLSPNGGIDWIPASDGDVLTAAEQAQLRSLAAEVAEKYTPALDQDGRPRPWDIEFGFVDGELTLFQIRPLVEKGQARTSLLMRRLFPARTTETGPVDPSARPLQPSP